MAKRKSKRRVAYSKFGVPLKYDGGSSTLARLIKRIAKLYKEGKRVPSSLIQRRIKLGKKLMGNGSRNKKTRRTRRKTKR